MDEATSLLLLLSGFALLLAGIAVTVLIARASLCRKLRRTEPQGLREMRANPRAPRPDARVSFTEE